MRSVLLTLAVVLLAFVAPSEAASARRKRPGPPPAPKPPADVILSYKVETRIRTRAVDADLWAGGALVMEASRTNGELALALKSVREHPWKFYRFDPLIGRSETKFGTMVTLPERSWKARAEADRETSERARATWQRWRDEWGGDDDLDGSFAFFVVGDIAKRFRVEVAPGGRVASIANNVTDRWVPNGLALWLSGQPVEGYAYWADDPQPPEWRTHTYDALAVALELLAQPALPGDDPGSIGDLRPGATFEHRHPRLVETTTSVVETLAPAAKGRLDATGSGVFVYRVADAGSGRIALTGEASREKKGLLIRATRSLVLEAPSGLPVSDRMQVEMVRGRDLLIRVEVAYAPE